MADNQGEITGTERAAIFLLALGEQDASEVLKYMGPKEVQKVSVSMAGMKNVTRSQVSNVLSEFRQVVDNETALGVGTDSYIRNVLTKALGPEKAGTIVDRILMGGQTSGLEELKWMDPRAVAEVVRLEHPQIIAIVLSYLESDQAAQVLAQFPDKVRSDLMMRIAALDGVQPSALQELNQIMERQFSGNASSNLKS